MPKLYLVGGAVRDMLLRRPTKDHDYLYVGATEDDVTTRWPTAQRVGQAFPVFLVSDPANNIVGEVALARRERKTGPGHSGFAVDFGPEVTLAEDLKRRDLTINAMALDLGDNELIDYYGGLADLNTKTLCHTSDAFAEDPLRVYRLARFAAELDFIVADETIDLCRQMPKHEIAGLSRERVRVEMLRALASPQPQRFFEVLQATQQLDVHFDEVAALSSVPAGPSQHHGEGDAFVHMMMVLSEAAKLSSSPYVRFAALCHDLGKALTDRQLLPRHLGHEDAGQVPVDVLCARLGLGKDYVRAALLGCTEHLNVHRFAEMKNTRKVDVIMAADRTTLKAEGLADVAEADGLGRIPSKSSNGPALLRRLAPVVRDAEIGTIPESLVGADIGLHIRAVRAAAIAKHMKGEV